LIENTPKQMRSLWNKRTSSFFYLFYSTLLPLLLRGSENQVCVDCLSITRWQTMMTKEELSAANTGKLLYVAVNV